MAINTNSKAYKSLLDKGYTADQIQQMSGAVAGGQKAKDVVANTQKGAMPQVTTNASVKQQIDARTNELSTRVNETNRQIDELRNQLSSKYGGTKPVKNGGPADGYANAKERNKATEGAEFKPQSNQTSTTPVTSTTSSTSSTSNYPNADKIRQGWDNMTYEQQQEALNKNPALKENIVRVGGTIKTAPTTGTTNTPTGTDTSSSKNADGTNWDYQDNSPERMKEMADNVNQIYMSNPGLFSDEDTFRNFFINGKGRTPEQEQFLMDFYKNREMYNKLDNYTSSQIGSMYVNRTVPDSYLTYLKNSDPNRYAEVMDAKSKAEDGIKNQAYLESLQSEAGIEDSSAMKYAKENKFLIDKNNDGVDDKLYIAPTEEELTKQNRINEIDSRIMEIKNMQKNLLDDLTEQYPGVPKATLMGIVQDRTKDLSREYDDLMVERTGLAGSVEYLQNERDMESEARQQTINNLKTAYGMYYDYSPEGMAELAQAQYAATNVTLEQADNGTDTQKQMALQGVLDGYYDKYGSIIQRSEQQVINDVMKLAKEKGISLSDALEENFLKYLRQKPGYDTLSNGGSLTADKWAKLTDDLLFNTETGEIISASGGGSLGGSGYGGDSEVASFINGLESKGYTIAGNGGSGGSKIRSGGCGTVVNDYLKDLGENIRLAEANDIAPYATSKIPAVGGIAYFNGKQSWATPATKEHGHVGIVTGDNGDTITVLESNEGTGLRYNTYKKSDVTGYYTPSSVQSGGQLWNPGLENIFEEWTNSKDDRMGKKDFWNQWSNEIKAAGLSEKEFLDQYNTWFEYYSKDFYKDILKNVDHLIEETGGDLSIMQRASLKSGMGGLATTYKKILSNLTLDELINVKNKGAKLGVLSDSDVKLIAQAATDLDWTDDQKTWNDALQTFRESILSKNKYLREEYENKSAWDNSKNINYNSSNKSYTIRTPKKGKSISNLGI